jgi:hypothetical protein
MMVGSDDPQARIKAAKAKALKVGVENLSDKDLQGSSRHAILSSTTTNRNVEMS